MLDFERKAFIETMVEMLKSDSNSYLVRVVYFEVDVDTAECIKHIVKAVQDIPRVTVVQERF